MSPTFCLLSFYVHGNAGHLFILLIWLRSKALYCIAFNYFIVHCSAYNDDCSHTSSPYKVPTVHPVHVSYFSTLTKHTKYLFYTPNPENSIIHLSSHTRRHSASTLLAPHISSYNDQVVVSHRIPLPPLFFFVPARVCVCNRVASHPSLLSSN